MKWLARQPRQRELVLLDGKGRPTLLEAHGAEQFREVCRREAAGELALEWFGPARGYTSRGFPAGNADWVFRVRYIQV